MTNLPQSETPRRTAGDILRQGAARIGRLFRRYILGSASGLALLIALSTVPALSVFVGDKPLRSLLFGLCSLSVMGVYLAFREAQEVIERQCAALEEFQAAMAERKGGADD